jgi:hypothetical protein
VGPAPLPGGRRLTACVAARAALVGVLHAPRSQLERRSYAGCVYRYQLQHAGFGIAHGHDTTRGDPLTRPSDVLALNPKPGFIRQR